MCRMPTAACRILSVARSSSARTGPETVPSGSNRGSLTFEQSDGNAITMPAFKDTGEATYQGEVFSGTYDITYAPSYYCSTGGPIPCQRLRLRKAVALGTSGSLDFDAKTVQVSGKLTKNGQKVPDSSS